jgi:hypothetical protein
MKCKYLKLLNRYIDGEITLEEKSFLDKHIVSCPYCEQESKSIARIGRAIKSMRVSIDTNIFWDNLKGKINNDLSVYKESESFSFDLGNFARKLIPVPIVFALLTVVILNLFPANNNLVDEYIFGTSLNNATESIIGVDSDKITSLLY